MNEVKKTVDSLSRRKLALLSERLKAGIVKTPRREISRRSNPTAPCPLSFAQQRLWFIDQLEPGNAVYNCPEEVRLEGRLNLEALERVINEVVRRHEVLRTRIEVSAEGEPMQVIDEWEPRRLEVEDLASLSPEERQREALRRAREEAGTGFDLKRGPLLRVKVLRLEEEEHVLLYTMHHIVSDWWSMGILVREVGELYRAYDAGESSPLEELPIQYADFAVWQREWLSGAVLEKGLDYWRGQLAEAESLELPTDHPRPATQSHRGARHHFVIEEAVAEKLRALSQREGVTLFMTLLGGFDVVMSRYSGQEDIVLGTDIANRNRAEIEGLIGFFVNQLVMRVNVKGRESFRELLKRVREVCLGAYAHQDVPFEKLVEELRLKRDLSRAPLFQAKLILLNAERERPELGSAKLSGLGDGAEMANVMKAAKFDLTVAIVEAGRDLVVATEYDRELFEPATIERLIGHYGNILKGIVEEEERAVSELSLLSDEEREQIVEEWNQTARMYPGEECLHELFAKQARQAPERIAVVSEWEQVSYRELNRRANQLGRYLQRLGVGPEVVVGLCLERSVEMVVGALGALKAGGVYLPLDAESPLERLGYMLEDAGVGAVLTQRALEERLPVFWGQTVLLDEEWERIEEESDSEPEREVDAENLAYVIYTSGSTGRPKGVEVSHSGLTNLALWHIDRYQLDLRARATQFAAVGFDAAVWEIWPTLVAGASLHIVNDSARLDPGRLLSWLTEQEITSAFLPTPVAEAVLKVEWPGQSKLGCLLTGGDRLRAVPKQVYPFRLANHYGPTENTVVATVHDVSFDEEEAPPIGRPIANTQVFIVDDHMQPAPVGVAGEIYIAGAGLARGYLGRPELTAEKFLPNPFSENKGERVYRTGDLARYRADGMIEYLGRMDHQVKVRGYRIELGEIEAVLDEHESVIQSVVVMKEDDMAEKRLVAYVVCDGERAPSVYELRSYLKEKLPEHMAPALFVWLEQMPLTPNGKVDRKALKVLKEGRIEPQTAYIPPRDSFELQIVQIWEQVLGIQPIGVTDNFFELGGHSLLAVSLMAKIRNTFKQDLPLSALFQGATVEKLGAMLRRDAGSRSWSCLVELRASGSKPPLFFVHPGGGGVLCYFDLARCLGSDQPIYGFQAPGFYGEQPSHTRLEDMAALYIEAMMTVQPEGPYLLGGWSLGGVIAYEMAQQLVAQGQSVGQLLLLDAGPRGPSEEDIGEHEDHLEHEEPARMDDALMLVGFFQGDLPVSEEDLKPFEGDERIDYVLKKAISMNLAPPGIEVAQAHSVLKMARANKKAMNNYKAQAYPGAVTLFKTAGKASMPHSVGPEFNEEMMKRIQDPTMGWGELAAGGVRVIDVPGDHGTMVRNPYVETLAVRIKECLNGAETLGS